MVMVISKNWVVIFDITTKCNNNQFTLPRKNANK